MLLEYHLIIFLSNWLINSSHFLAIFKKNFETRQKSKCSSIFKWFDLILVLLVHQIDYNVFMIGCTLHPYYRIIGGHFICNYSLTSMSSRIKSPTKKYFINSPDSVKYFDSLECNWIILISSIYCLWNNLNFFKC